MGAFKDDEPAAKLEDTMEREVERLAHTAQDHAGPRAHPEPLAAGAADRGRADSRRCGGMRGVPRGKRGDSCAAGDALAAGAHGVAFRYIPGHAARDGKRWAGS